MSTRKWVLLAATLVVLAVAGGWYGVMRVPGPMPSVSAPLVGGSEVSRLMQEARAASRAGDSKRAIELYTGALALEPGPNSASRDLRAARGSEYNALGLAREAYADYDAALKIGFPPPMSTAEVRAYMGRGYALVGLGEYARARDDFDVVLKEVPNEVPRSSSTLAWRGAAYQGLGDRARAIADYQAALALDPNNAYARTALADFNKP